MTIFQSNMHVSSSNVLNNLCGWLGGSDERFARWCLAKPCANEQFQATIHLLTLTFTVPPCLSRLCHPSLMLSITIDTSESRSVIYFFYVFCRSLTFWLQKTTAPEIAVAVPTVVQANQTSVRGTINRVCLRIKVMIFFCARSSSDSFFFFW